MDPQATLKRYVDAFAANEKEEMAQAADDYNSWVSGGGFSAKLLDGRLVYKLYGPNWRTAADVGGARKRHVFGYFLNGIPLTPQELADALRAPPESKRS